MWSSNSSSNQGVTRSIPESSLGRGQHAEAHSLGVAIDQHGIQQNPSDYILSEEFSGKFRLSLTRSHSKGLHLNIFVFNGVFSSMIPFA